MAKNKNLKITLKRSTIAIIPNHKKCIKGLGLRRINHTVVLTDTPAIRGMVNKVGYLLLVEEV